MRFQPGFRFGAAAPGTLLLDVYPGAYVAYSFRKLRTAYAGSAVRIRRSSDNAEADIGFSGNDFDTAAAATHIGGGSGFVVTWYDQTATGYNITNATAADQGAYSATGFNSLPTITCDAGGGYIGTADTFNGGSSSAISIFAVAQMDSGSVLSGRIMEIAPTSAGAAWNTSAGMVFERDQGVGNGLDVFHAGAQEAQKGVTYATPHRMAAIMDGSNVTVYVDGAGGTATGYTGMALDATATLRVATSNSTETWGPGLMSELVVYLSDQTSNQSGIDTDQSTYW
jgi:hypothetical protein